MPTRKTKNVPAKEKLNKISVEVSKKLRARSLSNPKSANISKSAKVLKTDKEENTLPVKKVEIGATITKSVFDLKTTIQPPSPPSESQPDECQPNQIDISIKVEDQKSQMEQLSTRTTKNLRVTDLSGDDSIKRAIAEIESEGSSAESSDYGQYYYYHNQEEEEQNDYIINDPEKLLYPDTISEDESSIDGEPEYVKQNELKTELDFLGNFGDVPHVDEVSIESTADLIHDIPTKIEEIKKVTHLDKGKFVNPLTGISSSSLTTKSSKEEIHEVHEVVQQLEEEQQLSDISDDILSINEFQEPDEDTEDLTKPKDEDETDTFEQFLEIKTEKEIVTQAVLDVEHKKREELERQMQQCAMEFINSLIDRCVEQAEYMDSDILIQKHLDKRKLLHDLKMKLSSLTVENSVRKFLNRKCVEYFRRKRTFRPIMNDNPKTLSQDIKKFNAATRDLDKLLIREEQLKSSSDFNLKNLRKKVIDTKDQTIEEITKLENLIRESFKRDNFDKLQIVVNNLIYKMSLVRKEISKVRFHLILKQHKEALLVEQLRNLEDLGNDLSMRNFENMQTETQALGKKIEERNAELKKQHFRCNTDIHNMAHLKEKQKMLRHTITIQKQYLEECLNDKKKLRDTIHQLKLNRNRIRYEIRDISFQGGLLDKPVLLRDYDETVHTVEKLQKKVDDCKSTVNRLNTKIAVLEKINCKRKS